MPATKTTARKKATAKKATAKKATAKKATATKATATKATAKKATAKKATAKKATAQKAATKMAATKKAIRVSSRTASKRGATSKRRTATPSGRKAANRAPGPDDPARPGDLIIIDSPQVGSAPREGEVLQVVHGEVSVSYRVKWTDGHETLIAPKSGAARIVRT